MSQLNDGISPLKTYFFPTEQIPRLSYTDPLADELIASEKPVVLTDLKLCHTASHWDLPYLQCNIGNALQTVYSSTSKNFKYFDHDRVNRPWENGKIVPPIRKHSMTFTEFVQKLKDWKSGDDRFYLQQTLNSSVGPAIVRDFLQFKWEWLTYQQKRNGWGPLTSNLLLVGMEGNVTPVHYDEQQNFFNQVIGYKRVILFPPECYDRLYPHTVNHPHDRQSQVDLENPDFERFPNLKKLQGVETVLGPGEVLFIPIYWWHQVESLNGFGHTVSVNFWYKSGNVDHIDYPLKPRQKLAVMRNIEKMLLEALKDPRDLGPLLRAIVDGRYDDVENH